MSLCSPNDILKWWTGRMRLNWPLWNPPRRRRASQGHYVSGWTLRYALAGDRCTLKHTRWQGSRSAAPEIWDQFLECSCLFSWFLKSLDNRIHFLFASQPWDEALNLLGEGRDKAVLVSSANRSLFEPQGCSLRYASTAAGPEPWGTWALAPSRARWDRSVHRGSTALSSADRACSAPKQATQRMCVSPPVKCVCPHPGRDERTS